MLPAYGLGHVLGATFGHLFTVLPPPRTIAVYLSTGPDGGLTHTLTTALFLLAGGAFGAVVSARVRQRRAVEADSARPSLSTTGVPTRSFGLGTVAGLVPVVLGLLWHPAPGPIVFWPLQDRGWLFPSYELLTTIYYLITMPVLFLVCALVGFVVAMGVAPLRTMARRVRPGA